MSSRPERSFFRRARFKLTLYYTTILLLFLAATGGLLYYRAYRSMLFELRKFLRDEADNLMVWVRRHEGDHDAIKMYTLDAAYSVFDEDFRGSIKVGKLADLTVCDLNLIEIDPTDVLDMNTVMTVVDGRIVYEAGQ